MPVTSSISSKEPEYRPIYSDNSDFLKYVSGSKETILDDNQKTIHAARRVGNETWKETSARVAYTAALANNQYPNDKSRSVLSDACSYYDTIQSLSMIPATPVLLNAGTDEQQMFSCFGVVMPDNLDGLYDMMHLSAKIFSKAAGIGFNVSGLRGKDCPVGNRGAFSAGVLQWLFMYYNNCKLIQTGAVGRRGAQAAIMDYKHPDIFDYCKAKTNPKHFINFNFSVILDAEFFKACDEDKMITCRTWKGEKPKRYSARRLLELIAQKAWFNGEPGCLFNDNVNKNNPIAHYSDINSVNPCMEIPTIHFGSCNLGTINLMRFTDNRGNFDFNGFDSSVRTSTRFLDALIDCNDYPDPRFEKVEKHLRSIGLGLMGFSDMLIKMKIPYDSSDARNLGDILSKRRADVSEDESMKMAEARGVAPVFEGDRHPKRRNAFLGTYAPTGSTSMLAGCSASIEPVFGLVMTKACMDGAKFSYINREFVDFLKSKNIPSIHYNIIKDYVLKHGAIRRFNKECKLYTDGDGNPIIPAPDQDFDVKEIRYWEDADVAHFATAHDVYYKHKLEMQAVFQKNTDQAISATLNFPSDATVEDVAESIRYAHSLGLKGFTSYRSDSRKGQVLNIGSETDKNSWVCKSCGSINIESDPDMDPEKVCIKCKACGCPSCAQK